LKIDNELHTNILEESGNLEFLFPDDVEDVADAYDALQACLALGEWASCRECIDVLRDNVDDKAILLDLAVKETQLTVIEGDFPSGVENIKKLKKKISTLGPGVYESRKALLYYLANDGPGYLKGLRSAADASDNHPIMLLDLALAEARLGSKDAAKQILDGIDTDELPPLGETFLRICRGIIALPSDLSSAQKELGLALMALITNSYNPAVWSILAMCAGWYALACRESGNMEDAETIVRSVWRILSMDPEKTLINKIKSEIPGVNGFITDGYSVQVGNIDFLKFGKTVEDVVGQRGKADDWELVSNIGFILFEKEQKQGVGSFSTPERYFYIIEGMMREVNNGGFSQFFVNSTGQLADVLVPALEAVSSVEARKIAGKAVDILGNPSSLDDNARVQHLGKITNDFEKDLWEDCDNAFYDLSEPLDALMLDYAEKNIDEFSE
jgi:hypothetical protein